MKKLKIPLLSIFIFQFVIIICSLQDSGKVPIPAKMYTKPVDVQQPHHFAKKPQTGVNYDPLPWNDFFDHQEKING